MQLNFLIIINLYKWIIKIIYHDFAYFALKFTGCVELKSVRFINLKQL